jgi:predicted DNA binding CopG/RHH family protein
VLFILYVVLARTPHRGPTTRTPTALRQQNNQLRFHAVEDLLVKHGGRVGRNLEIEVELKPAKLISIRLPEADIERTKKLAARKGLPYQTYLRSLLHEGLAREERKSKVKTPSA